MYDKSNAIYIYIYISVVTPTAAIVQNCMLTCRGKKLSILRKHELTSWAPQESLFSCQMLMSPVVCHCIMNSKVTLPLLMLVIIYTSG